MFRDKSGNGLASSIVKSSGSNFLFIALDRSVNTAVSSAIWQPPLRDYRLRLSMETFCDFSERTTIPLVSGIGLSLSIIPRCRGELPAGADLRRQSNRVYGTVVPA